MAAAGNTLDETIALTTAANTIVQNPNTVGTALKTLSLRIRGVKTELEEAGLETDGMAETTAKLQEKIKALSHGKVDIMIDANNFKSTTQILREMSDAYDEMTDVERAAALELLGGKRQANILSAILENFDIVEDAIEKSENSAGSALQENEKVLDSIQGRINQFNNALQTFWNHLLDSDVIKFFVTLGTKIIQLASAFGEVRTVIFALLMYLNMSKKYPFDLASWFFGPKGIKNILGGLKKVGNYLDGLTKKKSAPLSLPAPGLPPPKDSIGSTTPPHNPTDGYARLGAGPEPIDFDQVYGSKFSRMWKNHVSRLRDSANRVKQDFIDIWQHHNERVGQSVQYASSQFNKLKTSASNAFGAVSKMVGKMANNLRNSFSNIFASMGRTKVATQSQNVIPYIGDEQKTTKQVNRFSQIWQHHMVRLKDSIGRVKNDITTIWDHHNERVAQSAQYASAQFNKMKSSVTNTMHKVSQTISSATNKIRNSFVKATSKGTWYEDETGKVRRAKVMPSNLPANKQSAGENPSVAKRVAAEIGRIWKVHIANLKHNYQSLKGTFTTIWGHHKERVSASIKKTSAQFDAFKQKITNIQIPQWAKYAASGFKNFFSGAISFVQDKFGKLGQAVGNIFNKIKTTASATANAFKEKIGYNNQQNNTKSSTPMSWMDVSLSKTQLSVSDGDAAKIDLINAKLREGQQSFNDYMSGANNASDALKAYYASLNGAQGSISGFNTFLKNHNAGLKASGAAAKVAAVGHMALNAALSMGLSVLIQFAMEVLTKFIDYLKDLANPTEKLAEDISDLKSEIQDTESEISSINDQLDTCRDRMAELLALPSLSFVEQEELSNLEKEVALLERKLALEEALLARQESQLVEDTEEYIEEAWNKQGKYNIQGSTGIIREDTGWSGFWDNSKETTDILDDAMETYLEREAAIAEAENMLLNWDSTTQLDRRHLLTDLNLDYAIANTSKKYTFDQISQDQDLYKDMIEDAKNANIEVAKSIDSVFNDPQYAGLSYGMSNDINTFLDEFYAYQDKWNIMLGATDKSDSIASLFDKTSTVELQELGKQLRTIADDEKLSLEAQKTKIQSVINSINLESDAYSRLKTTMDTVGVTAQDIADYFTLDTGVFDSDTITGIMNQYTKASNVMRELKNMGSDNTFAINGVTFNWNEFFSEEDTGKFEARADKFAEILKGMDKNTRETFMSLSEQVKNGSISWDDAIKSLNLSGLVEASKIIEAQFSELNKSVFKDLDSELSGFIDTFSELSTALEDVASSMDLLKTAEQQMHSSGRISIKTALELIESTDRWNEVLTIENGKVMLNANAEEVLVQAKLNTIKANIQEALSAARLQLAQLGTANATLVSAEASDITTEAYQIYTDAMNTYSASIAGFGAALGALLDGDFFGIGKAFRSAYDATLTVKDHEATVASADLTQKIADLEAQAAMLEQIDTTGEFANYYEYDKTPGDKYDSDGNGVDDGIDDANREALEALQKKYERQIKNLDNQQTYIENEIEKLEAQDEAVSKSYYEKQIELEEKKLDLYKQERDALKQLEMTDEVADALWEVEHAIQESTLRMVEFRQSIIDLYTMAFDKAIEAYDNKDDFLSDQQNYIDKYRQLMEVNDSPLRVSGYQEQLDAEWAKKNTNIAELALLEQIYADAMANGLKEGSEEWVELQDKIRATEEAILDNNIAIEEYAEAMRQIPVEAFNSVRDMFGYQTDFLTKQQDYIEGYADYLEAIGVDVPREVYDKLIEIERDKRANTLEDLVDARQGLKDIEAQGFTAADEEWQDAYNQITDLEKRIQDCDIAMAQWEKTIRDMDFEKFERFTSRLDDLSSEIDHVRNLLDDEDVAFDDGTWTEEGITSLGLLYQQMKVAEQTSKEYAAKIEELNETYQSGAMSEQEYYERLQELKEGQWGAIESYEDAKDAIVDMEEARIDMIEEGINEEIEAFEELISLKKEELDAERDLYDFKKNIQKQTKDIASLQRRIASMSGSTDASTIAERTKLQAQLREAQEGLDDTYYSHSMDAQSKALDDENEAYVKSKEDYLEMLRDTLDDTAAIINTKISEFLLNADVGLGELNGISQEHGITLSDSLMQPWINASAVSETFKQNADLNLFSLINEDGIVTIFGNTATDAFNDAFGAGGSAATLFTTTVNDKIGEIKFTVEQAKSPLTANLKYPWENTASADGPINTFSEKANGAISNAVEKAKDNAQTMKTLLSSPWTGAGQAVNTFSGNVQTALDNAIKKIDEYVKKINEANNIKTPSYVPTTQTTPPTTYGGSGGTTKTPLHSGIIKQVSKADAPSQSVKALQQVLNMIFKSGLVDDGYWGLKTEAALRTAQQTMRNVLNGNWISVNGKYDSGTRSAMLSYINHLKANTRGMDAQVYDYAKNKLPVAFHAKGTMGTKRDELAITDESWIGEEITLAAGKNGQLQYLKKGSAVLPSDIANNLVEWGKINPDMSAFSNGLQGMNVMTSVLNKPELNLEFGSLLHIDNCSNEVIPEVKKMVTEALDKFSRQLNYSLRRVGAK